MKAKHFDGSGRLTDAEFVAKYGQLRAMSSNGKVHTAILKDGTYVRYDWQIAEYVTERKP